jgi:hypothetical protein
MLVSFRTLNALSHWTSSSGRRTKTRRKSLISGFLAALLAPEDLA